MTDAIVLVLALVAIGTSDFPDWVRLPAACACFLVWVWVCGKERP